MRGRHPPSREECANVSDKCGGVYLITAGLVLKNQTDQHQFVITEECAYVRQAQGRIHDYREGIVQQEVTST